MPRYGFGRDDEMTRQDADLDLESLQAAADMYDRLIASKAAQEDRAAEGMRDAADAAEARDTVAAADSGVPRCWDCGEPMTRRGVRDRWSCDCDQF